MGSQMYWLDIDIDNVISSNILVSAFHCPWPVRMPANNPDIDWIWCRLLSYILHYRLLQTHQHNLHQATDPYTCATSHYKTGGTFTGLQLLHNTTDLTTFFLMKLQFLRLHNGIMEYFFMITMSLLPIINFIEVCWWISSHLFCFQKYTLSVLQNFGISRNSVLTIHGGHWLV